MPVETSSAPTESANASRDLRENAKSWLLGIAVFGFVQALSTWISGTSVWLHIAQAIMKPFA
jgi:hypothetical protein